VRLVALVLLAGCRLDVPAGLPCDPEGPCLDADETVDAATDAGPLPRCGDNVVRAGVEECDDGNQSDDDGCTTLCSRCAIGDDSAVWPGTHHCYARFSTTRTWEGARADCAGRGLELATFQQAGEDEIVLAIREASGGYNLWFGLSELGAPGTWSWVTDEPLVEHHWAAGEPNGTGSCARFTDAAEWEDFPCGDAHQVVCEDAGWAIGPGAHAYKGLSAFYDWDQASAACVALGAHLVTVTGQEEHDFVEGAVAFASFWLGARADGPGYAWVTGEPVAFTAWGATEPAAVGTPACAVSAAGAWSASPCDGPMRHAVCEID
jgi:cysteine-rich repeat protein